MKYRTLMTIHGYIAIFFLPMAILYAVTGALYIVGKSGSASMSSVQFDLPGSWPASGDDALGLVNDLLQEYQLAEVGRLSELRAPNHHTYLWRGMGRNISLTRTSSSAAEVSVQDHSIFKQLVEVHKNHAGLLFSIIGFAFGLAMLALILSGAWMMFCSPVHRRSAIVLLAAGGTSCVTAYVVTLFT